MTLYVIAAYRNDAQKLRYAPGDVIEVDDVQGGWLLRDAPSCFSTSKPTKRQLTEAQNRMETGAQNRDTGDTMHSGNMPGVGRR